MLVSLGKQFNAVTERERFFSSLKSFCERKPTAEKDAENSGSEFKKKDDICGKRFIKI